jgi:hypothetical protein
MRAISRITLACILALMASPLHASKGKQATVDYACVVRETSRGYEQHPEASGADFSAAFEGFHPQNDGEKSDSATFGAPRWLAARIEGRTYIICVDNTPGVLTLHRASKRDGVWKRTKGSREIYHPELYNRLREAGLNIHTRDELKSMNREQRRHALSGKDAPIRPDKPTK